jgi:hypothetical protein
MGELFKTLAQWGLVIYTEWILCRLGVTILVNWLDYRRWSACPHTDWHQVVLPPALTPPWESYWVVCDRCGVVLVEYNLFDSARGLEGPS